MERKSIALLPFIFVFFTFSCSKNSMLSNPSNNAKKGAENKLEDRIPIPNKDLSDTLFDGVPQTLDYFKTMENVRISCEGEKIDMGHGFVAKNYYGKTIFVSLDDISLLYSDLPDGIKIEKIIIRGPCFLKKWNAMLGIDKNSIIGKWGEPNIANNEYLYYSTDINSVRFLLDSSGRVNEIQIYREP